MLKKTVGCCCGHSKRGLAAAGVRVEQVFTSHSITISTSRTQLESLTLLHTLPQTNPCVGMTPWFSLLSQWNALASLAHHAGWCSHRRLTQKGKERPHLCSECISTHHIFNLDLATGTQLVYWIVTVERTRRASFPRCAREFKNTHIPLSGADELCHKKLFRADSGVISMTPRLRGKEEGRREGEQRRWEKVWK